MLSRSSSRRRGALLALATSASLLIAGHARAGYYWGHGTLSSTPSLCFVGDSLANDPVWVDQILDYVSEFERAANIRFDYLGTCPPPVFLPGVGLIYLGDIRIALFPGSGLNWNDPVPGAGCTIGFVNSSFGREPDFLAGDRVCLYNLKLGKDSDAFGVPWRNHTLHEVGHALGLAHEHQRPDALDPTSCLPKASGCPTPGDPAHELVCVTPYDRDSVMNYQITSCGIDGNYGHSGLSPWDRLTLHILYPEEPRVAEVVGTRVVRTTEMLDLRSAWLARGANVSVVARAFQWRVGGVLTSQAATLQTSLGEGTYDLTLTHQDFLGRSYAYATKVRTLSPGEFERRISGALTFVPEPGSSWVLAVALSLACALRRRRGATRP